MTRSRSRRGDGVRNTANGERWLQRALAAAELELQPIFSDETRRAGGSLVVGAAITTAALVAGLMPTRIRAFGVHLDAVDQLALSKLLGAAVIYYAARFVPLAARDLLAVSMARGAKEEGEITSDIDNSDSDGDIYKQALRRRRLRVRAEGWPLKAARPLRRAIIAVEFGIPVLLAVIAIASVLLAHVDSSRLANDEPAALQPINEEAAAVQQSRRASDLKSTETAVEASSNKNAER